MTSEVKMPVVAYLVGDLRSGEPSLCFEDERGDYGSEDETPKFNDLVLQSDALAAIEAARVEARAKALEEAAKECDKLTHALDNAGVSYHRPAPADRCARAIRSLAKEAP